MDDKIQKINRCWDEVKPKSWGKNAQSSEREMLHVFLDRDEFPECMVKGTFLPEEPGPRDQFVAGIVVATNKRLVAVGGGGIQRSPTCTVLEYKDISTVTHETGMFSASIRISGPALRARKINGVRDKKSVEPFVDHLLTKVAEEVAKAKAEKELAEKELAEEQSEGAITDASPADSEC